MNGSHTLPALEVHAVSQAAEGTELSRTPRLRVARVDGAGDPGAGAVGRALRRTSGFLAYIDVDVVVMDPDVDFRRCAGRGAEG